VLDVLDIKYDAEGYKREDGRPEAKVASPYIFVIFDLKGGLDGGRSDEGSEGNLAERVRLIILQKSIAT
jgi:hypothetical protein